MAAPSTVYKDYMTRRRKGGSPNVDIDLYVAKFLQNTTPTTGDDWGDGYFNSTDTEAQKIAKIKDIFKIDGWIQVAKGTATTPEMGFIGYCISRTSANGLYHNWDNNTSPFVARGSGVRVPTTVNASAELLNDAGLNRMGEVSGISIKSFLVQGGIKLTAKYRSSFYNPTTDIGLYFKLSEAGDAYKRELGLTPAPKEIVQLSDYVVNNLAAENLVAGNPFYVAPYIKNEEGEKVFNYYQITILPYVDIFKYSSAQDASIAFVRGTGTPTADTYLAFTTYAKNINDLAYQPIEPEVEPDNINDFIEAELGTYVSNDKTGQDSVIFVDYYRVGLSLGNSPIFTEIGIFTPVFLIEEEFAMSDSSFSNGVYVPGEIPTSQLNAANIANDIAENYSSGQEISVYRNNNIADIGDAREKWYATSDLIASTPLATGTYIQEEPLDSTKYYFKSYGTSGKVIYFGNNITKPLSWA